MADTEKSAEEQLHDAVWTWVQRLVIALVLFGAGLFAGYYQWGDAIELRKQNKELQDRIVDLKNERETLSTQIARERRDKEVCQRDLRELKKTCK
ncbi:MAG: hypothetical protein D6815_12910 [Candidatus Dadabacteria bacterium]|nr:MAG: hypothetical protein D6815_12910 [Candidatus Dadabacteria bacterium]